MVKVFWRPEYPGVIEGFGGNVLDVKLADREEHPVSDSVKAWWLAHDDGFFAACRIELARRAQAGDREALVCFSTLERLYLRLDVHDRYFTALAWKLRDMEDACDGQV